MHAAQGLSYSAEWMRDNWCHRDADPEVCRITQQVAAFDYARIAAEKADAGVPGGVSPPSFQWHWCRHVGQVKRTCHMARMSSWP